MPDVMINDSKARRSENCHATPTAKHSRVQQIDTGTFDMLAKSLQEANAEYSAGDEAVALAPAELKRLADNELVDDALEKQHCIERAMAVVRPSTPTDAVRLAALCKGWLECMGDGGAEKASENLRRGVDSLLTYLLNAIPEPQRRTAVMGFRSHLWHTANRLYPDEHFEACKAETLRAKETAKNLLKPLITRHKCCRE